MRRSWEREVHNAPSGMKRDFQQISQDVLEGYSLDYAMRKSQLFPNMDCEMVRVGEAGGRMQDVFYNLADHYDSIVQLRRDLMRWIAWPLFQLVLAIGVVGLFILALGIVAQMTNSEPLDIFGLGMGTTGNFALYATIVVTFFGGLFILAFGTAKGWFGNLPYTIARKVPLIGAIIECLALGRMSWAISLAHEAGMDAIETLTLGLRTTQIHYYMQHVQSVVDCIRIQKKDMTYSLAQTESFPNDFLDSMATGELAGSITETMHRQAEDYKRRLQAHFKTLAFIGGVVMMLFVGCVIGFLVIYFAYMVIFKPYNDLINDL